MRSIPTGVGASAGGAGQSTNAGDFGVIAPLAGSTVSWRMRAVPAVRATALSPTYRLVPAGFMARKRGVTSTPNVRIVAAPRSPVAGSIGRDCTVPTGLAAPPMAA